MKIAAVTRILRQCSFKVIYHLVFNFARQGARAIRMFEKRRRKNAPFFPAFMMLSITNACNFNCKGCWVQQTSPSQQLSLKQIQGVINTARKYGSSFFGILGGEPLFYPELIPLFRQNPHAYFQLFTNGSVLTVEMAQQLAQLGNVTPLISIEGLETESEVRRGAENVFARTLEGVKNAVDAKLFVGVSASITARNIDELVSEKYLDLLIQKGVHYIWYYIYRPVGPCPDTQNALTKEQIQRVRQFIVDQRTRAKILIIDAYWDAEGRGVCPGAMGLSHHISPQGALEFCPPMQFTDSYLNEDGSNLETLLQSNALLSVLRHETACYSRNCILLDNPNHLHTILTQNHAKDSSMRDGYSELASMQHHPSHHDPEHLIPEKSLAYKFGKKYYFFGFGAYG